MNNDNEVTVVMTKAFRDYLRQLIDCDEGENVPDAVNPAEVDAFFL